jgi:hypothetical protein
MELPVFRRSTISSGPVPHVTRWIATFSYLTTDFD